MKKSKSIQKMKLFISFLVSILVITGAEAQLNQESSLVSEKIKI